MKFILHIKILTINLFIDRAYKKFINVKIVDNGRKALKYIKRNKISG